MRTFFPSRKCIGEHAFALSKTAFLILYEYLTLLFKVISLPNIFPKSFASKTIDQHGHMTCLKMLDMHSGQYCYHVFPNGPYFVVKLILIGRQARCRETIFQSATLTDQSNATSRTDRFLILCSRNNPTDVVHNADGILRHLQRFK